MRYSSTRPPYFRSQSHGIGRVKMFFIGAGVGGLLVFLGMTAWQSHQPVEIIVKTQNATTAAPVDAALLNDDNYVWSEGGLVGIKNPKENDKISGSVNVEGMANPPDGQVRARVTELIRGKVVTVGEAEATVKSDVPGTHGMFTVTIAIQPTRNQGTLEVSVLKKKGDKDVDTVIIPLQFIAEKKADPVPAKTTPKPAAATVPAETP